MAHPFITFDPNVEREAECIERARELWDRRHLIEPMRMVEYEDLAKINQRERFENFCRGPWANLFAIAREQYAELVVEFFASYSFEFPCDSLTDSKHGLKFRLGGVWHRLPVSKFARVLGLYRRSEVETPVFTDALTDFPSRAEKDDFWEEVTGERPYPARSAKATKLRDPLHRIIHRALFHVIGGRGDSHGNITTRELFHLYCIVRGIDCNVAISVAECLKRGSGSKGTSRIAGGGFVTVLAEHYHLLVPENQLTEVAPVELMGMRQFESMGMIMMVGRQRKMIGKDGRIWDPLPAAGESSHHQGARHHSPPPEPSIPGFDPQGTHTTGDVPDWQTAFADFSSPVGPGQTGPTYGDIWNRFERIEVAHEELRTGFGQHATSIREIQTEQRRQGEILDDWDDFQYRGWDWLFQTYRPVPGAATIEPPSFSPRTIARQQQRQRQRESGRGDEAGSSGAGQGQ